MSADAAGLYSLCETLRVQTVERLDDETLRRNFSAAWPILEPTVRPVSGALAAASRSQRLAALTEFLVGLERIATGLEERNFHADVAIGCGRSGGVLAGILATNLGIRHVLTFDRIVTPDATKELHYAFGGLIALQPPPGLLRVVLCAMNVESGETLEATRALLRRHAWPSEPGDRLQVVAMFATETVRVRKPYMIVGIDSYRGLDALRTLPYMFRPYDFTTPRQTQD